ncbi:hypothetical protein [Thiocapsa imhoffii]|nr:hypothetical protein [Thiocapsa imhoffii]
MLKNRSEADLRWEWETLTQMLAGSLYDAMPVSSKTQVLLGYVESRRDQTRPGRVAQMVIFTQFWDTLEDLVRRLRQAESKLLVGTYSGRGGQYTDPHTGKLVGTERDEIKQRFLRGEIDILALTIDRTIYDDGVASLGPQLRFATYGEPVFDAILALSEDWPPPGCVRRIAVTPQGLDLQYVAFVANDLGTELHLITDLATLAAFDLDETVTLSEADTLPFIAQLQVLADAEYRLTGHVMGVESDNERSGRAQAALALGTAFGFIKGRQKTGLADENFWKELDACRNRIAERLTQVGGISVDRVPVIYEQVATAFVPFDVKRKISDESFWVDNAPPPLLNAALDAAARVGDGIKKKKSALSTDFVLSKIATEMKRILMTG